MNYPKTTLVWQQHRNRNKITHTLVQVTHFYDGARSFKLTGIRVRKFNGQYLVSREYPDLIGFTLRLNKAKALAEATFILGE